MNDQPVPEQQPEEASITLTDLQNIISVLDLASSRGAFRGPELEPVGQLYNKFKKFVDNAMALNAAQQEGQTANG